MGVNDKLAATFHPTSAYECVVCEREHTTALAAHYCCSRIIPGDD